MNPLVHYLESERPEAVGSRNGSVFRLEIHDVELEIGWLDSHWIAEPQQLPFLRALSVDQIRAQLRAD